MLAFLQYSVAAAVIGAGGFVAYKRFRPLAKAEGKDHDTLNTLIHSSRVLVLSKSYCPYCSSTKALLNQLDAKDVQVVELDLRSDGEGIQSAALELTGQRTVPNVFIGGKHIGGNDKMQLLYRKGELVPMLKAVGSL